VIGRRPFKISTNSNVRSHVSRFEKALEVSKVFVCSVCVCMCVCVCVCVC